MTTQAKIEQMIGYLILKLEERDWHGVADAAMDLRELEVQDKLERQVYYQSISKNMQLELPGVFSGNY